MRSAAEAVLPAIRAAARKVGTDFSALVNTARVESGFNPRARARGSSAGGLFQFIDSTWLATLRRHGAKYGLAPKSRGEALALRNDPTAASLMAAEHMAENRATLGKALGRAPNATDLYLAHFLGVGGATRFLAARARDGRQPASAFFPKAARANPAIFRSGGAPRSLDDVYALFTRKMAAAGAGFGSGAAAGSGAGVAPLSRAARSVAPLPVATPVAGLAGDMPPALAIRIALLSTLSAGMFGEDGDSALPAALALRAGVAGGDPTTGAGGYGAAGRGLAGYGVAVPGGQGMTGAGASAGGAELARLMLARFGG